MRIRRGAAKSADATAVPAVPAVPSPAAGEPGISRRGLSPVWVARISVGAVWALLAVAAVGGVTALAAGGGNGPASAPAAAADGPDAPVLGPAGWAELYVAAYLTAGPGEGVEALRAYLPGVAGLEGSPAGTFRAGRTTAVDVEAVPDQAGAWSVTVAVDVLAAGEAGTDDLGTRYYQVAAHPVTGQRAWVAAALPQLVPAPAGGASVALAYTEPLPLAGLEADTVGRFLAALVAGAGDVTRYTAPGAAVPPGSTDAFAQVQLRNLLAAPTEEDTPTVREVLATVAATDSVGRTQVLTYALTVAVRDDRWEVSRLRPAPLLAPEPINPEQETQP